MLGQVFLGLGILETDSHMTEEGGCRVTRLTPAPSMIYPGVECIGQASGVTLSCPLFGIFLYLGNEFLVFAVCGLGSFSLLPRIVAHRAGGLAGPFPVCAHWGVSNGNRSTKLRCRQRSYICTVKM